MTVFQAPASRVDMAPLWRSPLLAAGIVLLVLGLGNWLVSRNKIAEYSHRIDPDGGVARMGNLAEYPRLTPQTNATLLARLHRGLGDYTFNTAKLDLYQVISGGGLVLSLVGLLLIGFTSVRTLLERRARPTAES